MEIMETIKYVMFLGGFVAFVLVVFGAVLFAAVYQTVRDKVHESRRRNPTLPRANGWTYLWACEHLLNDLVRFRR